MKEYIMNGPEDFEFVKVPYAESDEIDRRNEELKAAVEKTGLPKQLRTVANALKFIGIFGVLVILRLIKRGISFAEIMISVPWIVFGSAALIIIGFVVSQINKNSMKKKKDAPEVLDAKDAVKKARQDACKVLGTPDGAYTADILTFKYRMKKDKVIPIAEQDTGHMHKATECCIFADGDSVCIIDPTLGKISIPKSELDSINRTKERIFIYNWNKDEPCDPERFEGCIIHKHAENIELDYCYILELTHNGEKWGIYIPPYDIAAFEAATGLSAK